MSAARKILATGKTLQATRLAYGADDSAARHEHALEQCGVVLSGAFRLRFDGRDVELGAGDAYTVPALTPHSFEVLKPGEVIVVASHNQELADAAAN